MIVSSKFRSIEVSSNYTLDFSYSEESKIHSKKIYINLYRPVDQETSIVEKSLSWPEKDLPEIDYDPSQGVISLRGKRSVGQIPFRVPKLHVKLPEKSKNPSYSINVLPGFKKKGRRSKHAAVENDEKPEPMLFMNLQSVIQQPTIESNWSNLTMDCDAVESFSSLIGTGSEKDFHTEAQLSVLKLILQRAEINPGNAEFLLGKLLDLRIFKSRVFGEMVQLLLDYENVPLIRVFLKSPATFLIDETYVKLLRFCAELDSPANFELFNLLMDKSFTANFLPKYIETVLHSEHVTKILEMCQNMVIASETNSHKTKRTIDLLSTLLDSYAHKLLWEDSNLPSLVKMRATLNEMIQLISSYSNLMSTYEARTDLPNISAGPLTDYAVRKVKLKSKYV